MMKSINRFYFKNKNKFRFVTYPLSFIIYAFVLSQLRNYSLTTVEQLGVLYAIVEILKKITK